MGNEVTNGRRTNLQILNDKREELKQSLVTYKQYLDVIPAEKQEDFKKNFLELATQDYLLSIVEPKEIIRFAANVTKIGLNIAPSANEVYIVPFDTKINGQKVMLPQAIIPYNGLQQLAYQNNFMLTCDPVYQFSETEAGAARELTRLQQAKLDTANPEWIAEHFIGYDVIFSDLKGELPQQVYFVDKSYVIAATKTNKDPRWSLSTWTHKAVRKAYKQFLVPRDRALEQFEKLESLNDSVLKDADIVNTEAEKAEVRNFEEIQKALQPLQIELNFSNGVSVATGNTYNNAKTLQGLGFSFKDGKYVINTTAPIPTKAGEILNPFEEYGLEIREKSVKGKTYQIIEGNTEGLDDLLHKEGFTFGKTGRWGREKNLFA